MLPQRWLRRRKKSKDGSQSAESLGVTSHLGFLKSELRSAALRRVLKTVPRTRVQERRIRSMTFRSHLLMIVAVLGAFFSALSAFGQTAKPATAPQATTPMATE